MKTWIIVIAAVVLIVLAGIVTAQILDNEQSIKVGQDCSSGSGCPYAESGGCTQGSNCGLPGCGAATGNSNCGCGRG